MLNSVTGLRVVIMTIFRCAGVVVLWTTTAFAQPDEAGTSNNWAHGETSPAFGAKIIDIALTFDAAAQQSLVRLPETDVPAQMSFIDANGVTRKYDVTIHVKGRSGSRRALDGKPAFKAKLGKDDRFFGLEHLTLNNMVQDATMLREALGYQVYDLAGAMVPTAGYVRLTVNGLAYGLYLNLETIDAHFLKRRFGDDSGILYEGAYGDDLRMEDLNKLELHEGLDPNRATLKALIRAIDAPGDDVFYGAPPQVDTASFLAMMAAQALLSDGDNYYTSNNYRIYWSRSARRWFFIPTGIDQAFGGYGPTTVFGARGLLFQKCLASERCTSEYADKVADVAGQFESLDLPAKMTSLLSLIAGASQADPKKNYDAATMTAARAALRSFIAKRPTDVRAALAYIDGGHEATIGACAGAVVVNESLHQCVEAVTGQPPQRGTVVTVSRCRGGADQRWRLVAKGDAFQFAIVGSGNCLGVTDGSSSVGALLQQQTCAGTANQLFSLHPAESGTQLVAKQSGKCAAVAPGGSQGPALIQVACSQGLAQRWHVQRSIYP
jgi:CotH kinase protein/Ricin-type beta-trefoil lectin domain